MKVQLQHIFNGIEWASLLRRVDWFLPGGILFLYFLSGMMQMDFAAPQAFYNDKITTMVTAKTLLQYRTILTNYRLGFPAYFNMLGFTTLPLTQYISLFISALFSKNIFTIINIYYMIILALNYSSAYFVSRKFTADKIISCFVGLFFAFTPYLFFRAATGHDTLAGYYSVPLAFLLGIRLENIADFSSLRNAYKHYFSIATCCILFVVAYSEAYYAAFTLMLLAIMGLILGAQKKSWKPIIISVIACCSIAILILIALSPSFLYLASISAHLTTRSYTEQAIVGTRFSDLIWTASQYFTFPKAHNYFLWRGSAEGYDFWPGLPLSLIFLGFLFFHFFVRDGIQTFCDKDAKLTAQPATIRALLAFSGFSLLFSIPYGLGLLFNFFITPTIRSQNRISVFFLYAMLLACACILAQAKRICHLRKKASGRILFAGVLLVFFLFNSYPWVGGFARQQKQLLSSPIYKSEVKSLHNILVGIHAYSCRKVLQLPITFHPEAPQIGAFLPYNHLLPYILDNVKSDTAWSYGLMENDPAYQVQQILSRLPAPSLVPYARYLGFDSMLVEKRAYSTDELPFLQLALTDSGCRLVTQDGLRQLYLLPTVPSPQGDPFPFAGRWLSIAADSEWRPTLRTGWTVLRSGVAMPTRSLQTFVVPLRITPTSGACIEMELGLPPTFEGTLQTEVSCDGHKLGTWELPASGGGGSQVKRLVLTAEQTGGLLFPIVTFNSKVKDTPLRVTKTPKKEIVPGLLLRHIRLNTLPVE